MRRASALLVLLPAVAAQDRVDFARDVWPILEQRCVECHREPHRDDRGRLQRPKAGLRLDGKGFILRGSEAGEVVVAGEPGESLLYTLTSLDEDDPDRMPERGDALTAAQQETLRRWIAQGAPFGNWVGAGGEESAPAPRAAAVPPQVDVLGRLAEGLEPAPADAVAAAADAGARITPAVPGSPLLRVAFHGREAETDDDAVAALAPLREHVTVLVLGRTAITDRALATVARMPRLTHLDLHGTAIGDRGLSALGALGALRSLNLHDTAVGDPGLRALERLTELERLYLWQSDATADGVARLRAALPAAVIDLAPELPPPERRDGDGARRR